jgi:alpha-tubulin suppressor-like RCC1 family protein
LKTGSVRDILSFYGTGDMGVVSIQAGSYYCMAITSLGKIWAWGVPENTESLGFGGELSPSLYPQLVPALKNYNVSRCKSPSIHALTACE